MALGSGMMIPSLFALLQSCKETSRLSWTPQFLSVKQAELISSLVDTILPKTVTPGALEMKVDMFIDLVYGKLNTKESQTAMAEAMEAFDAKAKDTYGERFADLSAADKTAMLQAEEKSAPKYNGSVWGTAVGVQEPVGFYRSLKSLALWGYFSSEEIGKNVLSYDPVPGPYQGCIPLAEVGKTYSL